MSNDLVWAIGSDQQFPYHDERMINLWFKVLKYLKPDAVDYLGDVSDQACYSRFSMGTPNEFLAKYATEEATPEYYLGFVESEEKIVREFYSRTRELLPNADMFVALGNHDIRVWDYLEKKVPDIVEQVTPEFLWGLDSIGADYIYYGDLPKHRFGDIHVHHGNAVSKHAGESVKADVDNWGVSLIRGHSHRMGDFFKTYELRNETIRGYEIGHMSDVKDAGMMYTNVHNWQHGFAYGIIENGEYPHIFTVAVSPDYTCYIGRKKFSA